MARRRDTGGEVPGKPRSLARLGLFAQLSLRLPGELATQLKAHCQESGQSLNKTVAEALELYLGSGGRQR